MKRSIFCLLLTAACVLALPSTPALAATQEFATGQDWTDRMSPREKFMSLIPPSILFAEYNVHLRLALPQYMRVIDQVMERNPQLREEEISSIFASTVYLLEPENRPALKEMEFNYLRGEFETPNIDVPRLSIEDILRETAPTEA